MEHNSQLVLSLEELEQMAVSHSSRVQQAVAAIRAAGGERLAATAYPNPTVAYDAGSIGADGTAGPQGGFIDQEIIRGGKRQLADLAGSANLQRRQWQCAGEQLRVLNDVRHRYYDLLILNWRIHLQKQFIEAANQVAQRAEQLQQADSDEVEEPDLILAASTVRRQRLELMELESRYTAAVEQLRTVIGQPWGTMLAVQGEPTTQLAGLDRNEQQWWEYVSANPELQAARTDVQRQRVNVQLARAQWTPNVTVRAGASYDYASEETHGRFRLSVPLPINTRNQGELITAEANLRRSALEVTRLESVFKGRLAEALDRHRRYSALVSTYATEILPEAERAYLSFLERFSDEKSSYSRVSSAQQNYRDSLVEYLDALMELRRVEADLSTQLLKPRLNITSIDLEQ